MTILLQILLSLQCYFIFISFDLYKKLLKYLNSLLTPEETKVQKRLKKFLSAT